MIQRKQTIQQQIAKLEGDVKNAFKDYCNIPYYLHAILIHDGTAESGHYYSFIFDRKSQSWWRFSDVNVGPEVETVVMNESFGGLNDSKKTAYCLIYINQFCLDSIVSQQNSAFMMHKQQNVVPNGLRDIIVKENNSFTQ